MQPSRTGAATATVTTGVFNPALVALDGAGNLFVVNQSGATPGVAEYAPPYTGSQIFVNDTDIDVPSAILFTP